MEEFFSDEFSELYINFILNNLDKNCLIDVITAVGPKIWNLISMNKNITMKNVENNPELQWNYEYISLNPNLTIEFIKRNLDKNWNWEYISRHKNITTK